MLSLGGEPGTLRAVHELGVESSLGIGFGAPALYRRGAGRDILRTVPSAPGPVYPGRAMSISRSRGIPSPSRRALVSGAASGVAAGAVLGGADPARAASTYAPAHHRGRPLLGTAARHLVGRFSYGVTPTLAAQVRAAGGARAWFEAQLDPASLSDRGTDATRDWWPSLSRDATDLWRRQRDGVEGVWEVMFDYQRWVLVRRMRSRRQLLEVMTEFWENHFNVPVNGDAQGFWRAQYGDVVRADALGRFEDLLQATITHPAMLISLDNVDSTKTHPNENLGRELLELHTVGRGNYAEDDVKGSARILTGWSVDMWSTFQPVYRRKWHATGEVRVMGFSHPNTDPDGHDVTRAYLGYLAHHPGTAHRIARKLAVKFVSDDPPEQLVEDLAQAYLDHDTAIAPVLRVLVASPAFAGSVGAKVRDPGEDIVASYRALDLRLAAPPAGDEGDEYAANALLWQVDGIGTKPFDWPRPDGQPVDNRSWASPSRLLASMDLHLSLSGGWWPTRGVTYHPPASWVPDFPMRFDLLVDHLSQVLLHRRSTAQLLEACCLAVDVGPRARITRDHDLVRWNMPRLLTTFLDSPAFLTR